MAKTETTVNNLKINRGTYANIQANLSSIGENELIITTDKNLPVPSTSDAGKVISVGSNGEYTLQPTSPSGVTSVGIINGGGLTVSGSPITSSGSITVGHATGTGTSTSNTGRTYVQNIELDTYGHITNVTNATETVVDTNTTYSLSVNGTGDNANKLGLTAGGSGSGTTWVTVPYATSSSSADSVAWVDVVGHNAGVDADLGINTTSGDTTKFLNNKGGWTTPTDTNTTYSLSGALSNHTFTSTLTAGGSGSGTSTSALTLAAGGNILLMDDTSNKKITITATDTTYTFANGTNGFTVTPSGGTAQTVTVTPSIDTLENDLTLLKTGSTPGDSYSLIFQRGTLTDNYNDWKIQDRGGYLYFDQRGSSSTSWSNQVMFNTTGVVTASGFSGSGASLTNLNASNIASGTLNEARLPDISSDKVVKSTTNVTIATNDVLPIFDNSDSNKLKGSISFDTANSTQFLRKDGTWAIPGNVILSYGSSTWQDFIDAYNANRVIYCRASSNTDPSSGSQTRMAFMAYMNNGTTPSYVEFQYYRSVATHSNTQQGDQVYTYKLDKTAGWTVTVREAYTKIVAGTNMSSSYKNGTLTLNGTNGATYYGVCGTAAATAEKVVTCEGFVLKTGVRISIRFTKGSTSTSVMSLDVNNTGAKNCGVYLYNGTWQTYANRCEKNEILEFMYDGTYWVTLTPYTLRNFGNYSARLTSANISLPNGGLQYFLATSSMTTGKTPADAHILNFNWDNGTTYAAQLAVGHGTTAGHLWTRGQIGTEATWSDWLEVPRLSGALTNGQIVVSDESTGTALLKGGPAIDTTDTTKFLRHDGTWQVPSAGLPSVTSADNGKVLMVVNGAWAVASLPLYDGSVT